MASQAPTPPAALDRERREQHDEQRQHGQDEGAGPVQPGQQHLPGAAGVRTERGAALASVRAPGSVSRNSRPNGRSRPYPVGCATAIDGADGGDREHRREQAPRLVVGAAEEAQPRPPAGEHASRAPRRPARRRAGSRRRAGPSRAAARSARRSRRAGSAGARAARRTRSSAIDDAEHRRDAGRARWRSPAGSPRSAGSADRRPAAPVPMRAAERRRHDPGEEHAAGSDPPLAGADAEHQRGERDRQVEARGRRATLVRGARPARAGRARRCRGRPWRRRPGPARTAGSP